MVEEETEETQEKTYTCKICGQEFSDAVSLARHTKSEHPKPKPEESEEEPEKEMEEPKPEEEKGEDTNGKHQCPYCEKKFTTKQALGSHLGKVHKEETKEEVEKEEYIPPEEQLILDRKSRLREALRLAPKVPPTSAKWVIDNFGADPTLQQNPNVLFYMLTSDIQIRPVIAQRIVMRTFADLFKQEEAQGMMPIFPPAQKQPPYQPMFPYQQPQQGAQPYPVTPMQPQQRGYPAQQPYPSPYGYPQPIQPPYQPTERTYTDVDIQKIRLREKEAAKKDAQQMAEKIAKDITEKDKKDQEIKTLKEGMVGLGNMIEELQKGGIPQQKPPEDQTLKTITTLKEAGIIGGKAKEGEEAEKAKEAKEALTEKIITSLLDAQLKAKEEGKPQEDVMTKAITTLKDLGLIGKKEEGGMTKAELDEKFKSFAEAMGKDFKIKGLEERAASAEEIARRPVVSPGAEPASDDAKILNKGIETLQFQLANFNKTMQTVIQNLPQLLPPAAPAGLPVGYTKEELEKIEKGLEEKPPVKGVKPPAEEKPKAEPAVPAEEIGLLEQMLDKTEVVSE